MPRHLQPSEKKRAEIVLDMIGVLGKGLCGMIYVPTLFKALASDGTMQVEESIQLVRDLLSFGVIEMHFDQQLRPVAKADERFVFPAPAATNPNSACPYPLLYVRLIPPSEETICGLDHCGANAPDFKQHPLLIDGSYKQWIEETEEWSTGRVNVDIESYDLIAVNSSAGKDSQAMLDAVFRECRRRGIEDRIRVYFADLESAEWPGAAELASRQVQYYGLPFSSVKRPQGDLLALIRERGDWPDYKNRYCTSRCKTAQINTLFTRDVKQMHEDMKSIGENPRRVRVLNCLGIRAQEGDKRSKKPPFKESSIEHGSNKTKRQVDVWYPIFQWTNVDVWNTIARSGVPHHFAYDLSMPRLSCPFCFYGDRNCLLLSGIYNPEMLDKYVAIEQHFKRTGKPRPQFKSDVSIAEIRKAILSGERPSGKIDIQT